MRTRSTAAAITLALLLGACGGSSATENMGGTPAAGGQPATTEGAEVALQTFAFVPRTLTIDAGTTVTWTNNDDILHTVTSGIGQKQGVPGVSKNKDAKLDGLFDQEMESVGATFSFTFEEAGTYDYFCAIHPGMTGKVVVR